MTLVLGCLFCLASAALLVASAVVLGRVLELTQTEYRAVLRADEETWSTVYMEAVARGDDEAERKAVTVLCGLVKQRQEAEPWV